MELTHLLDTSALIAPPELKPGAGRRLGTSIVCVGELQAAVLLARTAKLRAERVAQLTATASTLVTLDIDARVATAYGELRASTGRGPANDLWIAATANAHGLVLITRDKGLAQLPGIQAELV